MKIEESGIGNWVNDDEYDETCVQCVHYDDYGCMVAHYTSVDGKCGIDGHEIPGSLRKCSIGKFCSRLNKKRDL